MENQSAQVAVVAHYGLLLGIKSPWQVRRVDLQLMADRVEVDVERVPEAAVACPQCGRTCARYDHAPQRRWRHLDAVHVPWAEPHGRSTVMFEAFAVTIIQAARSFVQAMEILKVDWHTIQEIVRQAVKRGLLRRSTESVRQVGMDEKSFGRSQNYVSLMTDLNSRRVLDVVPGRDTASALELCERNLRASRARCHKEAFAEFCTQPDARHAATFFRKWFGATRRSQLDPIKKTALTLQSDLSGLLSYFVHPIANAISEGFNSKMQAIKADARGFRRFDNYRERILFQRGKLDLRPALP